MPHISLTPAKYAAHLETAENLRRAEARVAELHAAPDANARELLDAEQAVIDARLKHDNSIPWADSPEDVTHESSDRIALDGGHADVDVFSDRVEVTIRLGDRSVLGIALSHMEAANLGRAIASPHGATTGDLFHVADELGVDASTILRLRETAVTA